MQTAWSWKEVHRMTAWLYRAVVFSEERCLQQAREVLRNRTGCDYLQDISGLRADVRQDLQAALRADPACASEDEIVTCYPGFYAVCVYRVAHLLYAQGMPLMPRMMTELAHSRTGIDIHPGAQIAQGCFIDHGTGVVIGQTAQIGRGVKLYQGVTLGAFSTAGGATLRGIKRHPTVQDDVTIYANATILGGETVIGRGSVIGAGVFLTASVQENTVVTQGKPALRFSAHHENTAANQPSYFVNGISNTANLE